VKFHRDSYTGRHLPYGITQCYLPPDTSERAPPSPQPVSRYSIYLPRRDGRLSWPRLPGNAPAWNRTRDVWITSPTSYHYTNRATQIMHRCWTSVPNFMKIGVLLFEKSHRASRTSEPTNLRDHKTSRMRVALAVVLSHVDCGFLIEILDMALWQCSH